jgi:hypothetical protein
MLHKTTTRQPNLYLYNLYFTVPLLELSRFQYEICQYNITEYKNYIQKYNPFTVD